MRTLVTFLAFIVVLGTGPMVMAQSAAPLVAEGLSLPRDHQYERYNAGAGTYTKVDVSQVPALVKQKQPVYDRTAKAWVYNSPKGLDPRYAAAAAPATAPAAKAPAAPAPATTAPAAKAPAATAPAATAPATAPAATAPAATAPAATAPGEWQRIHGKIESIDGSTMKFRADDGRALTVDVSKVASNVRGGLTPGEGVTVITNESTGPTSVRATYVQQDSSDPARGGKAAPATAPANPPLVADGLSLPPDHQYERYNASTSAYGKVEASQVPALVKQKVPIYDRTAKVWVLSPDGKLDPRYAAAAPGAAAVSTPASPALTLPAAATPLAASGLTLPKDHQYERFNPGSSTYTKVDVKKVPALVDQKVPIYDRTAKVWVLNTEKKLDPRYGTTSSAMPLSSLPAGQSLTLPKDHQYERYDLASATYMKIDVSQVPTLVQQKIPVYDRTAKTWVLDTEQQVDSRYVAGAARPK